MITYIMFISAEADLSYLNREFRWIYDFMERKCKTSASKSKECDQNVFDWSAGNTKVFPGHRDHVVRKEEDEGEVLKNIWRTGFFIF